MNDFFEGDVVICGTGQAGTVCQKSAGEIWVLLRNGNIWISSYESQVRHPQSQEDLDSCPVDVERIEPKIVHRED